ncbi:MAG: hypothetical protein U0802_15500 [Candidatus Binatia bacterium]
MKNAQRPLRQAGALLRQQRQRRLRPGRAAIIDRNAGPGQYDGGEPFTDANGNGRYDANAAERFIDVNGNQAGTAPSRWRLDKGDALYSRRPCW